MSIYTLGELKDKLTELENKHKQSNEFTFKIIGPRIVTEGDGIYYEYPEQVTLKRVCLKHIYIDIKKYKNAEKIKTYHSKTYKDQPIQISIPALNEQSLDVYDYIPGVFRLTESDTTPKRLTESEIKLLTQNNPNNPSKQSVQNKENITIIENIIEQRTNVLLFYNDLRSETHLESTIVGDISRTFTGWFLPKKTGETTFVESTKIGGKSKRRRKQTKRRSSRRSKKSRSRK
jgi:hypothetical protein